MKRFAKILPVFILFLILGMPGCSSNSDESKMSDSSTSAKGSSNSGEMSFTEKKAKDNAKTNTGKLEVSSQMVIYQAEVEMRVTNFEKSIQNLEEKAQQYGGYISESNVRKEGKEQVNGNIKLRIPQKNFQAFLHEAESEAADVISRNITGQDVTEEYVDLGSRLKSKKVVEERLISFMKGAAKTEDLLKISTDLAAVQEEIETIEGKMKFLENQTSLSTINITLYEKKVVVPNLNKDDLNTWERTKKQFMSSTNAIITGFSVLVVFFVGNLPILIILAIVAYLGFIYVKKKKKK